MSEMPDDIVVTQVTLDEPGPDNGDNIIAEAEGDLHWSGTFKRVTLKLGNALLQLTYDTESQESATNAAVLIASAATGLPMLDQAQLEPEDKINGDDDLAVDDQRFLLDQLTKDDSDYNDELEGWINFDTRATDEFGRRIVKVTFEDDDEDDRTTIVGRWALEWLGGEETIETHDLEDGQ